MNMLYQYFHFIARLSEVMAQPKAWLFAVFFACVNYFAGHSFVVFLVVAATLIDAAWGIAVSLKKGEFTKSELARLTIAKLAVYGCVMFVFIGLDKFINSTITASIIGAAIVLVEFWSSCASMLILYPNFLFLRLLKKALTGEIAAKLGVSEDEVKEILEGKK